MSEIVFAEINSPPQSDAGSSTFDIPSYDISTPATPSSLFFDDRLGRLLREVPHNQHILVTGGLGFIGSHTTLELLKAGYNVIAIDNLSNAYESVSDRIQLLASKYHEEQGTPMPSLKHYKQDYQDIKSLIPLLEAHRTLSWDSPKSSIAGVIHFASYKAVEDSIKQPLKYYSNNVCGLIGFVETLGSFGIKTFIFSSSATVYGTLATSGAPLKEELCVHKPEGTKTDQESWSTVQPGCTGITNPYGRTKWMCEAILADLAISDPEWTIVALRYFNPIGCDSSGLLGEDPRCTPTNLLPVIVKVMTGQYSELSMFGTDWDTVDGTAVRDFIHVTDLAQGHIAALSVAMKGELRENFRTFNLGTGYGHSVLEVVETMQQVSQKTLPRKAVDRRAGDVGYCVAAADRSSDELQWTARKTLSDACADICHSLEISGLTNL
ncbi:UDP-glucose 4-epimerase [Talaromyces proteolyticus]|uniref:UDP-glucose 4-epimerase n=1 Tax=Talaromyces proteolyticus TaxID=1131652 RepID=A0AAD4KLF2_9EURO|nr:UDP-glucose 4-epimerase [Talaromyces proteolyticus]KAH8694063.1 UDP-glucose 4-epimerase [Talaromyces proteolyticus]